MVTPDAFTRPLIRLVSLEYSLMVRLEPCEFRKQYYDKISIHRIFEVCFRNETKLKKKFSVGGGRLPLAIGKHLEGGGERKNAWLGGGRQRNGSIRNAGSLENRCGIMSLPSCICHSTFANTCTYTSDALLISLGK